MRPKALLSWMPSVVDRKAPMAEEVWSASPTGAGEPPGAPSKKYATGTPRRRAASCNRLALMRFLPLSYFWICWKVMPRCPPSFA